ncbi:MAG: hypothetical protein UH850_03420 [Paludibacteraceae bacterium]|nr:hypothetical protein [Paludibacteraceae bacterium]
MQNVKLESGDWVCCPSDKDKWEYLRWSAALPATKKYMPVVLTDKILESNGFERQDVGVFRLKRRRQVELRKSRGFFYVDIFKEKIVCSHVHQLQHLLRLCGMEEFANKIEI